MSSFLAISLPPLQVAVTLTIWQIFPVKKLLYIYKSFLDHPNTYVF